MKKTFQGITSVMSAIIVMGALSFTALFFEGKILKDLFETIFSSKYLFANMWPFILLMIITIPIIYFTTLTICETYIKLIKKSNIRWLNTTFYNR